MEVLFFDTANFWSDIVWEASYLLKTTKSIFSSIILNARKNKWFFLFLYRIPLFTVKPSRGFPCSSEMPEEILRFCLFWHPKTERNNLIFSCFLFIFLLLVLSPQNSSRQKVLLDESKWVFSPFHWRSSGQVFSNCWRLSNSSRSTSFLLIFQFSSRNAL